MKTKFEMMPTYSAWDYFCQCRARTYACSFSMHNSDDIWKKYGTGGENGKACIVFNFGKLRSMLNLNFGAKDSKFIYDGIICDQIFNINYGIIKYVDWENYQANDVKLPNPIIYTYLKSKRYSNENEFRISLSAFGLGKYTLNGRRTLEFPDEIQVKFDFKSAFVNGVIQEIEFSGSCDKDFMKRELGKLNIELCFLHV